MSRFFFPPPLDATAAAVDSHTLWDNLNTHLLVYQIFDLYLHCIGASFQLTLFIYPKKINYYLCEN